MNLSQAAQIIQNAVDAMNISYGEVLFDEWFLLQTNAVPWKVPYYRGPRFNQQTDIYKEIQPLEKDLTDPQLPTGTFRMARDSETEPENFDAFIVAAPCLCLFFNNTTKRMPELAMHSNWFRCEPDIKYLAEKFRRDQIEI